MQLREIEKEKDKGERKRKSIRITILIKRVDRAKVANSVIL